MLLVVVLSILAIRFGLFLNLGLAAFRTGLPGAHLGGIFGRLLIGVGYRRCFFLFGLFHDRARVTAGAAAVGAAVGRLLLGRIVVGWNFGEGMLVDFLVLESLVIADQPSWIGRCGSLRQVLGQGSYRFLPVVALDLIMDTVCQLSIAHHRVVANARSFDTHLHLVTNRKLAFVHLSGRSIRTAKTSSRSTHAAIRSLQSRQSVCDNVLVNLFGNKKHEAVDLGRPQSFDAKNKTSLVEARWTPIPIVRQ